MLANVRLPRRIMRSPFSSRACALQVQYDRNSSTFLKQSVRVLLASLRFYPHVILPHSALAFLKTRTENVVGWYHSHPFDVSAHSNAFLSSTDVSTQLMWQLSEDAAGNPFVSLVVDPLRGLAKDKPEIGAFRCYPPAYTPPRGLAPDGVVWEDERALKARWGESCQSYYQMVR